MRCERLRSLSRPHDFLYRIEMIMAFTNQTALKDPIINRDYSAIIQRTIPLFKNEISERY